MSHRTHSLLQCPTPVPLNYLCVPLLSLSTPFVRPSCPIQLLLCHAPVPFTLPCPTQPLSRPTFVPFNLFHVPLLSHSLLPCPTPVPINSFHVPLLTHSTPSMSHLCLAARRSELVGGMCSMLPYGTGICCYAFIYCFEFFLLLLSIPFLYFFKNLVLINRRNGPRYQRVLALCAFSTGVIPKGLILRKVCVRCLCMFCFL